MNHVSRTLTAPDGRAFKSHAWELREGGYRKSLLLLGYPFWPVAREKRLVDFLTARGFRVNALELGPARSEPAAPGLAAIRSAAADYAAGLCASGLPLYVLAASFSAPVVLPLLAGMSGLRAVALVAPVLALPPPGLRKPAWPLSTKAELTVGDDALSGQPELLADLLGEGSPVLRFPKRDLGLLAEESAPAARSAALAELASKTALAAFLGEDDPFVPEPSRSLLASSGAKLHSYPRVRHAPAYDRLADNFFVDLGSFLDGIEAAGGRS